MNACGSKLWRSLEQAADDPAFLARAAQEFPGLAEALAEPLDRRQVLRLMAASLVMGGLGACDSKFGGNLIPAVKMPPNIIPALPNFYATAHVLDGYASGVVVTTIMGRPIKVDGNPDHPASLGAIDVFAQAQLLDFYDPDRAAQISVRGDPSDRQSLETALAAQRAVLADKHGAGLRILTGTVTSPTLAAQIDALRRQYPEAQWVQWEPISRDAVQQGAIAGLRAARRCHRAPGQVDVLLAIDSDLLSTAPGRAALCARLCQPPQSDPHLDHEPGLCDRADADPARVGGRSSLHRRTAGTAAASLLRSPPAFLQNAPSASAPSWVSAVISRSESRPRSSAGACGPGAASRIARAGARDERGVGRARNHLRSDRAGRA